MTGALNEKNLLLSGHSTWDLFEQRAAYDARESWGGGGGGGGGYLTRSTLAARGPPRNQRPDVHCAHEYKLLANVINFLGFIIFTNTN